MKKTVDWVLSNINKDAGIVISDKNRLSYPEVSGYLIPTLINLGYRKEAIRIGRWLSHSQNEDGSISLGNDKFLFDTAMVLMGWQALRDIHLDDFDRNINAATKFIMSQINADGSFKLQYHMNGVPEKILIWCATVLEKEGYDMSHVWNYHLNKKEFLTFDCLSHFYCYVLDACLESKWIQTHTMYAMDVHATIQQLSLSQRPIGSIPAYRDVNWVCYTGIAQAAILFYKIGLNEEGNNALKYLNAIRNEDGSFYGSDGTYFPNEKISWAAKFYTDAFQLMVEKHMDDTFDNFIDSIDQNDVRFKYIKNKLNDLKCVDTVLDLGCGKSRFLKALMEENICDFHGLDVSIRAADYLPSQPLAHVEKGLATNLPYRNNQFDFVYSVEVFEHIPDLVENTLREITRVLKSTGTFVLIDKDKNFKGNKESWEEWFDKEDMILLMKKYFKDVSAMQLSDQFIGWTCCNKI